MRNHAPVGVLVGVLVALLVPAAGLSAQEGKSAAVEASLAALPRSLYFVLPAKQVPAGKKAGLVVVLPGGDGSREFLPWVENGLLAQRPDDCAGVLVTSVMWQPDQQIIWPTSKSKVPDMKYTTEDYVRAVVDEVDKTQGIDRSRCIVVAWSSSGPAVYPMLVAKDSPFVGGYVAMSIWPNNLGDLAAAKGRRFLLDQSPEDQTTTFGHVREAFAALTKAGAVVRLSTYQGGHGWQDDPLPRLREGMRWLLSDEPAPKPVWPEGKAKKAGSGKKGANLVANPGFEQGLEGWNAIDNSKRIEIAIAKDERSDGKQSLHLKKTGAMPLDLVTQEIDLPEGSTFTASVRYKSKAATNAWIKVWLYGDGDEALNKDVNLARAVADGDWQKVEKVWECKGAKRAVVQFVMVMGGELWLDDVVLEVGK